MYSCTFLHEILLFNMSYSANIQHDSAIFFIVLHVFARFIGVIFVTIAAIDQLAIKANNSILYFMKNYLLQTPVWQLTAEQLLELIRDDEKETPIMKEETNRKFVYGIRGIAEIFGCSVPTANRIKASGKIDGAITQLGRKIIVDTDLALQLARKKNGGR